MDLLNRMLGCDRWLNEQLFDACATLSDEQLDEEFDIGHRTIRATLDHIVFNLAAWTAAMMGTDEQPTRGGDSITELRERHDTAAEHFKLHARRVQAANRLDETFVDGWGITQSQGTTILQIALHNQWHRSEITHILVRLGFTDLDDLDPQTWEHTVVSPRLILAR